MPKANFLINAGALLLVLFIDGMGLGLVLPILNGLIFDADSQFLSTSNPILQNIIYGGILGSFMLCWFFGAAILGDLSDKIGRKKSLMICLFGTFLGYVLSALAVFAHSLSLLVLGRVIAGFTSGSQPIAQAAIVDISLPQDKTRNIGYILLALSLGFIVGPLLGGVLSDNHLVSWFNFSIPFYFAAIVSFINMGLLWFLFNETFVSKSTTFKIDYYQAVHIFISAFKHPGIKKLSMLYFIFMIGWSAFYSFIGLFLLKIYQFTPTEVSLFMALMGVGFGIGNGYVANFLAKRIPLNELFMGSSLFSGIMIFLMSVLDSSLFNWLILIPIACAVSVAYTAILTLFSDNVDADNQGWVMGVTGSIMAFVFGANCLIVSLLAAFGAKWPIYAAALCLSLTAMATFILVNSKKKLC